MLGRLFRKSQSPPPRNNPSRIERFTQRTRHILSASEHIAEQLHHNQISPEHILLALVLAEDTAASRVMRELGVDKQRVQEIVEQRTREKKQRPGPLDLDTDTKHALRLAVDQSRNLHQMYVGTEHLLLGLMNQPYGPAAKVMRQAGVNPEEVFNQTRKLLLVGITGDVSAAERLAALLASDAAQNLQLRLIITDKSSETTKIQTTLSISQLQDHLLNILSQAVVDGRRDKLLELDTESGKIEIFVIEEDA